MALLHYGKEKTDKNAIRECLGDVTGEDSCALCVCVCVCVFVYRTWNDVWILFLTASRTHHGLHLVGSL